MSASKPWCRRGMNSPRLARYGEPPRKAVPKSTTGIITMSTSCSTTGNGRSLPTCSPERTARQFNPKDAVVQAQQRRARRLTTYEQVWALHRQGSTGDALARQLRIGKSTVFRDLRSATFPERRGRSDRGRSVLDPYKGYTQHSCRNYR